MFGFFYIYKRVKYVWYVLGLYCYYWFVLYIDFSYWIIRLRFVVIIIKVYLGEIKRIIGNWNIVIYFYLIIFFIYCIKVKYGFKFSS